MYIVGPPGNFGGGVQSYFLFLRFLVVLNFVSFLLIAGFVLIPSIVFRSVGTSLVNSTGNVVFKLQLISRYPEGHTWLFVFMVLHFQLVPAF